MGPLSCFRLAALVSIPLPGTLWVPPLCLDGSLTAPNPSRETLEPVARAVPPPPANGFASGSVSRPSGPR